MLKLLRGERTLAQTQKALFIVAALVVILTMAFFSATGLLIQHQINANHATLHQIQQSRLESCRRTYMILTELIAASADHKHLTRTQKSDLVQYERLVDPRRCVKDVR